MQAPLLTIATPSIEEDTAVEADTDLEKNWKVIIHNNDRTNAIF